MIGLRRGPLIDLKRGGIAFLAATARTALIQTPNLAFSDEVRQHAADRVGVGVEVPDQFADWSAVMFRQIGFEV